MSYRTNYPIYMHSRAHENRYSNASEHLSEPRRPIPSSLTQPRCSRSLGLAQAGGFLWRWDLRLQRPSIRAGSSARHPILSASCDTCWKAQRRRPHLCDGVLCRPGIFAGRLPQHHSRGVTRQRPSGYPSLSTAPCGNTPVSRKRQSARSNLRATATIPIRRKRLPPLPKRSRNQTLRALSG
jgi:hypothetical protein